MRFDTYIASVGLRQTKQRHAILKAILELGSHVDAETIANEARKIDKSIGLATVYRNLQLLTAAGLIAERQFGNGRTQFEFVATNETHHDHLICNQCGVIVEFFNEELEQLQEKVTRGLGFKLVSHKMDLFADCELVPKGQDKCNRNF